MSRPYWYVCHTYECPVCSGGHNIRERVYEKPASYWIHHVAYDWCDAF